MHVYIHVYIYIYICMCARARECAATNLRGLVGADRLDEVGAVVRVEEEGAWRSASGARAGRAARAAREG